MNLYYDCPICNVEKCLKKEMIFCTSDVDNITPNDPKCKRAEYPKKGMTNE